MNNLVAELEHRLAESEAAQDVAELILARIEEQLERRGGLLPHDEVSRLAAGESPVRIWREFRKDTAAALARKTGISPQMLSDIETGKRDGSLRTIAALARALRVDVDELVPWDTESANAGEGVRLRRRP
jgi:DNA-binding XRE family transcriptional regulator